MGDRYAMHSYDGLYFCCTRLVPVELPGVHDAVPHEAVHNVTGVHVYDDHCVALLAVLLLL